MGHIDAVIVFDQFSARRHSVSSRYCLRRQIVVADNGINGVKTQIVETVSLAVFRAFRGVSVAEKVGVQKIAYFGNFFFADILHCYSALSYHFAVFAQEHSPKSETVTAVSRNLSVQPFARFAFAESVRVCVHDLFVIKHKAERTEVRLGHFFEYKSQCNNAERVVFVVHKRIIISRLAFCNHAYLTDFAFLAYFVVISTKKCYFIDELRERVMKYVFKNYKTTLAACFTGYICQAIVNNFAPLLFLTFQTQLGVPLAQVTLLIVINFAVQLAVDLLAAKFVEKIGYRTSAVAAHLFIGTGLVLLGVLPLAVGNAFYGLLAAVLVYSVGGGITEVLLSPLVENCPTKNKSAAMSLLHSFYCWGSVAVIGFSTLFFRLLGIDFWNKLAIIWSVVPFLNAIFFLFVPIVPPLGDGEPHGFASLFRSKFFWVLVLMMFFGGASEIAVAQWASAFVESGLGVSKSLGDLLGPCMFAVMMGVVRTVYAKAGQKLNLTKLIIVCAVVCTVSYILITLSPWAELSLLGCALCGLSVAMMWPGTFSIAAKTLPRGGTAMFALLALAGDLGCSAGPTLVGAVSSAFGDDLQKGILVAVLFPALLIAVSVFFFFMEKNPAKTLRF